MNKKHISILLLIFLATWAGYLLSKKSIIENVFDTGLSFEPLEVLKGFPISPLDQSDESLNQFYVKASQSQADVISWAGPSNRLNEGGNLAFINASLSGQYDYVPVFITDHHDKKSIKDFVRSYQPKMIGIGNEVNRLEEEELESFINDFPSLYDEIKQISPETLVFVGFQFENLSGRYDGLLEGESEPKAENLDLLKKFEKADLIGFSSYPGLIFKDPKEVPSDYYLKIKEYTQKPILFTEIAWPSDTEAKNWESNQDEQSEFVSRLPELLSGLDVKIIIWSLLYDQQISPPFTSIGLIDKSMTDKKALQAWIDL